MRIGINTLAVNQGSSSRVYLFNLLRQIARIDRENDYFIFVSRDFMNLFNIDQPNFRTIICSIDIAKKINRIIYENVILPSLLNKYAIDIFHSPNNVLPLKVPCSSVVTIHFLINFVMPECFTPFYKRWFFNTFMRFTVKKANKIIAVSENLKKEIINYLEADRKKIVVIHHGVDNDFMPTDNKAINSELLQKLGIRLPYIMGLANTVSNKNLERLFLAYDYLKKHYEIPHQLVLIGSFAANQKKQSSLHNIYININQLYKNDLVITGYLEHLALPIIYSRADVFVLPSLCESFGIPLLEAMKCGVPIVTSNLSAMPEVVGDAALKVNPYDVKSIADGILAILQDTGGAQNLVEKGFQQSQKFTWERVALKTLQVYHEVYQNGP